MAFVVCRFRNNPELFSEKVKLCVKNSQDHLYDPPPVDDPHYLRFDPYDREKHESVRESILNPKVLEFLNFHNLVRRCCLVSNKSIMFPEK